MIREVHDSQLAFGQSVGLSPGRIAQLVSGRETNVGHATLSVLLRAFPRMNHQEELYDAWRATYAPAPAELGIPTADDEDAAIEDFFDSVPQRINSGRVRVVLKASRELWRTLRNDRRRAKLATLAAKHYAESSFLLDRRVSGMVAAQQMAALAADCHEPELEAIAIYVQSIGARFLGDQGGPATADRLLHELSERLGSWSPRLPEERSGKRDLEHALARDGLLVALDRIDAGGNGEDRAEARLKAFRESLTSLENQESIVIGREVESRALLKLGQLDAAAQALFQATQHARSSSLLTRIKVGLSEIRLLIALGDCGTAWPKITSLVELCETHNVQHYRLELRRLEDHIFETQACLP